MTGYPTELLELDLDLEADLGVDTVKQAEVFAAVRERWDIPRIENLRLRDFPTLRHVIGFVHDNATTLPTMEADPAPTAPKPSADAAGTTTNQAEPAASAVVHAVSAVVGDLAATDRVPRRVPVPVLRPALAQCVTTGVALGSRSRVVVAGDRGGVASALVKRLTKLGAQVLLVDPAQPEQQLTAQLAEWAAAGPVTGLYWLPALDDEGPLSGLDLAGWRDALRIRVKALHRAIRALGTGFGGEGTFLVSGTRLGGRHGYDQSGATAPLGGAVTGFTKTFSRERPAALVKAVDFPISRKTAAVADALLDETLRDPGAVEIGLGDGLRWAIGLRPAPFGDGTGGAPLGPDTVFVVTGAAGSIVSAIVADLATASHGTFHLLDLTPTPDPTDTDLRRYVEDRDGLKAELATRIRDAGGKPTPVAIDRELVKLERSHAALAAIQAVEAAGGAARYASVNLTDPAAVAAVIDEVRAEHGRIDVLLHAAGLEISRAIEDKQPAEFDLVFDVKSDGWFNLLHAAGDLPIGATVVFSSVAGRFGNAGQTDYSSANDLLCKTTSSFRTSRPATRGIALDWTAWGGIGMATRGSIPKIMEMAGIEMLPPDAGIAWIRRELTAGDDRGEVLVAGELGLLGAESSPHGGLDPAAVDLIGSGPMLSRATRAGLYSGLVTEVDLDPSRQPFLFDHQIEGTPVLPGVMGVEGFAELGRLLLPGRHVAVEDVDFRAPVKFYRGEPRTLTFRAQLVEERTDRLDRQDRPDVVAIAALEGIRAVKGAPEPQRTTHFTAKVRLSSTPLASPAPAWDSTLLKEAADVVSAADIYRIYFHGPAYQVLAAAWRSDGAVVGRMAADLPVDRDPVNAPLATAPRLLELCFQTAGVWQIGRTGRMGLPAHADQVRVLRDPATVTGPVYGVARPRPDGAFDCAAVDVAGEVVVALDGYRTVELPDAVPADLLAPLATAMADAGSGYSAGSDPGTVS